MFAVTEFECISFLADMVAVVREVLRRGMSINLHMFHGGTNFGFMTGALAKPSYKALIASYGLSSFYTTQSEKGVQIVHAVDQGFPEWGHDPI